jgi:hypothetical protein
MIEFEVKTVKKLLKFFNVPYAKIDSTTTILNRGNAILNKEVVLFSDTRDIRTLLTPFIRSLIPPIPNTELDLAFFFKVPLKKES